MAAAFAGHASLALEFARAQRDRERLAVYEDRDRIARDLHDLVIQRLFATGLTLQGLSKYVETAERPRLESAVDDLDGTIREIRRTIFSLRAAEGRTTSLRGEILDLAANAAVSLGFEPHVRLEGPIDSVVPAEVSPHLLAVLREALSNVTRHSDARSVHVNVKASGSEVTLTVIDDGRGIAGSAPAQRPGQHAAPRREPGRDVPSRRVTRTPRLRRRQGRADRVPGSSGASRWRTDRRSLFPAPVRVSRGCQPAARDRSRAAAVSPPAAYPSCSFVAKTAACVRLSKPSFASMLDT